MDLDHRPHVLIVEDDRDTREVVRLILESEGMLVTEAADGYDALERLHAFRARFPDHPCVILLDVMMPRLSGTEFRRNQLRDRLLEGVPVVVLSAVAEQAALGELDIFARVSKPFDPEELIAIVRHACQSHAARERNSL